MVLDELRFQPFQNFKLLLVSGVWNLFSMLLGSDEKFYGNRIWLLLQMSVAHAAADGLSHLPETLIEQTPKLIRH